MTKMLANQLKILIVDDNESFRKAVKLFLIGELNCLVVGEASTGREFLNLIRIKDVDIVLMDIQMPDLDGVSATKQWCLVNPHTKVIALTMYTDKAYLYPLIGAGFKGCVFKTRFYEEILQAINTVISGKLYFNPGMSINDNE